ncbi:MAG: glutathione reductase (NADPH) [Polyangiales bacterium]|jgi:glutathione reductase (NADPH)
MSSDTTYDLAVLGGGSGGVRAARLAGQLGKKVCVIEGRDLGGTCVHRGCVPKKFMVYASRFTHDFEDAAAYGWNLGAEPTFDWSTLIANKDKELARLGGLYRKGLDSAGVEVIEGFGRFTDAHTIAVGERTIHAKNILVTVGGSPVTLLAEGTELSISSDEIFHLDALPKRVLVVGGGYIGIEFACLLNLLGSETHLVHRGPHLLRTFDQECSDFLAEGMREAGVHLHLNETVSSLRKCADGIDVVLPSGEEITVDVVLRATGRQPNTERLNLGSAGVDTGDWGQILVNEKFRTSAKHIFALGDVITRMELTPVAIAEAIVFIDELYGSGEKTIDYDNIPTAIFSTPTMSTVGLSEEDAWKLKRPLSFFTSSFRPMKQSLSGRAGRSFMKLIVDTESDRVLGAHMVGEHSGEILQAMAVAIRCGATKKDLDGTIGIHPTAAEEFVQMRSVTRHEQL